MKKLHRPVAMRIMLGVKMSFQLSRLTTLTCQRFFFKSNKREQVQNFPQDNKCKIFPIPWLRVRISAGRALKERQCTLKGQARYVNVWGSVHWKGVYKVRDKDLLDQVHKLLFGSSAQIFPCGEIYALDPTKEDCVHCFPI